MNPTLAKDFLAMDMFFNFPEMKLKVVNWLQVRHSLSFSERIVVLGQYQG